MTAILWGYDPGQQGALAVLQVAEGQTRPTLLWSMALTRPARAGAEGLAAHRLAVCNAIRIAENISRDIGVRAPGLVAIEIPAAGGKSSGGKRALSLAQVYRDAGWMAGLVRGTYGLEAVEVESGAWARSLNLPAGKQAGAYGLPEGFHRVGEAQLYADTSQSPLAPGHRASKAAQTQCVSRAEAVLIAVAAWRGRP